MNGATLSREMSTPLIRPTSMPTSSEMTTTTQTAG